MATATSITLPRSIYDEIITHALEGAPEEICGILGGRDGVAIELVRGRNEAANRIMDYWVDGQTLLKQFDFEDRGEEMIAIYHSHPVDEAYPSATDARNAFYPTQSTSFARSCSVIDQSSGPIGCLLKIYLNLPYA